MGAQTFGEGQGSESFLADASWHSVQEFTDLTRMLISQLLGPLPSRPLRTLL